MVKNNLKRKDSYYKRSGMLPIKVSSYIRKSGAILHGARALNEHFPPHLDKHTEDWDVFIKSPEKHARKLERELDKEYKGDFFEVKKGEHKGTWKVKSKITGKTVVDFTQPTKTVSHKTTLDGIKYAKIKYIKEKLMKILRDKSKKFRHEKDKEALQRIEIYKKLYEEKKW